MPRINLLPEEFQSLEQEENKKEIKVAAAAVAADSAAWAVTPAIFTAGSTKAKTPKVNFVGSPKRSFPKGSKVQTKPTKLASRVPHKTAPPRALGGRAAAPWVNLIPEAGGLAKQRALKSLLIWAGFLILAEAVIIIPGYFLFNRFLESRQAEVKKITDQIQIIQKEVESYSQENKEAFQAQKRFDVLSSLIDQHVYWTIFFRFLEDKTLPEIFYTSATVDGNRITLVGRAPSFLAVAKQFLIFNQAPELLQRSITGLNLIDQDAPGGRVKLVGFDLNLAIKPDLLKLK